MFAAPRLVAVPNSPFTNRSQSSSLTNLFGAGAQMAVEGAEGFDIAGRGATLILQASWFKRSSCSRAKEIAAIRVYDYRAFTSPRISSFFPCCDFLRLGGAYVEFDEDSTKFFLHAGLKGFKLGINSLLYCHGISLQIYNVEAFHLLSG
ncbi:hypothetical protein B296_00047623 [Ensete ventricosum]|uniref:Uncharacterized protein n=1 Tax=Ensete ventricosum TaxID=4639 RepID=A0A426YRT3_ENSVE|nr:hypothetical protein B296_00047623 [Ensete ventricosum]